MLSRRFASLLMTLFVCAISACVPELRISDAAAGDARDIASDVTRTDVILPDGGVCPAGRVLCGGACVDVRGDASNCGGCGIVCTAGPNGTPACSAGMCALTCAIGFGDCDHNVATGCEVDLGGDETHCGTCSTECMGATNAAAVCTTGTCGIACRSGFGDCDGNSTNGCEARLDTAATCGTCGNHCSGTTPLCALSGGAATCVASCAAGSMTCTSSCVNVDSDPNHCGGCDTICPAATNGRATCTSGACQLVCDTGFHRCGAQCVSDGSTASCGAACSPCPAPPHAMPTCSGGACGIVCSAGFGDCDGDPTNGCEASLLTDPAHCGTCPNACSFAHAGAMCINGGCNLGACAAGYASCNSIADDGCETLLASSTSHCGACGNACAAGQICAGGTCMASTCGAGTGNCDGNAGNGCETSLSNDPNNCGSCGNVCSFGNASPQCSGGSCSLGACVSGFGNCDGNAGNGCETPLGNDPGNCGACGNGCSFANASAGCSGGSCQFGGCNGGFGNCDGNAGNGCETDLSRSLGNCGACGNGCSIANGAAICSGGVCGVDSCVGGYANCNGLVGDGCESRIDSDPNNCGACGRVCSAFGAQSVGCSGSTCTMVCDDNHADCNGNPSDGCETDLTSPDHCGSCTLVCPQLRRQCCWAETQSSYCARPIDQCPFI